MTIIISITKFALGIRFTSRCRLVFVIGWIVIIGGFIFMLLGFGWLVGLLIIVMLAGLSFVVVIGLLVVFRYVCYGEWWGHAIMLLVSYCFCWYCCCCYCYWYCYCYYEFTTPTPSPPSTSSPTPPTTFPWSNQKLYPPSTFPTRTSPSYHQLDKI